MEESSEYYEIDLLQLLRALWRKAWVIILAAVVGGTVLFLYATFLVTPLYKAEAMMYVNNSSFTAGNYISNAELTAAQSLVDTYIIILNSRTTLNEVAKEAGLDYSYEELKKMLTVEPVNQTELFSITVTDDDPREAELIANTIVNILPDKIADVVDGSSVQVVDYAGFPSQKAFPNITLFTAIGVLLGIAVSCMVVIIQQISDTLIHNEDYLMEAYALPVLAVIPDLFDDSEESYYSTYKAKEGRR